MDHMVLGNHNLFSSLWCKEMRRILLHSCTNYSSDPCCACDVEYEEEKEEEESLATKVQDTGEK